MERIVLNAKDIFKDSFLSLFPTGVSPSRLALAMLIAFVIGMGIFFVYRKCFIGAVYDHSFCLSLVLMTILTSFIIVTISSNITLSLGMVGALSIVRYRTAIKNPLDLMFLFWSIASGIAIGAEFYLFTIVAYVFVVLVFAFLRSFGKKGKTYVLVVDYSADSGAEERILQQLSSYKPNVSSKITKNNHVELTVRIHMNKPNVSFTSKLQQINGVSGTTLVEYRNSAEL